MPKITGLPTGTPKLTDVVPGVDKVASVTDQYTWQSVLAMMLGGIYPVGCVYTDTTGVNPNITLGMGTWTQYSKGRVLVGQDGSQTEFDTAEEVGGEKNHQLTYSEMPQHNHPISDPGHRHQTCDAGQVVFLAGSTNTTTDNRAGGYAQITWGNTNTGYSTTGISTGLQGDNVPHNNLQPYTVVYFWKRTA